MPPSMYAQHFAEFFPFSAAVAALSTAAPATGTVMVVGAAASRVNFVGTATTWNSGTPTITPDAGSLGAITVDSDTTCHANFTPPAGAATITFTDSTDGGSTATLTVVAAATGYSLSGPSSGANGAASTNFTVTVTPSGSAVDSAVTVTAAISPDGSPSGTVSLAARTVNASGTFTVTPASIGAHTVSVTDNGGLTDPTSLAYDSQAIPGVYNDTNLIFDLDWVQQSGYAETIDDGASIYCKFTGTSIAFEVSVQGFVDQGLASSAWPTVQYWSDYGTIAGVDLSNLTPDGSNVIRANIATGLSAGGATHLAKFWLSAIDPAQDLWTPKSSLRFIRFCTSAGADLASTSAYPYTRSKIAYFYGDSTIRGRSQNWSEAVAAALDARMGQQGHGSWAWGTGVGAINLPAFHVVGNTSQQVWRWYWSGQSRLSGATFVTQPDYVFVNLGTNSGAVQATVADWLVQVRTAAPSAWIFVIVPFGGFARTNLTAAVAAASSDSRVKLLDIGIPAEGDGTSEPNIGLTGTIASFRAADTLHPDNLAQSELAARVVALAKDAMVVSSGGGSGSTVRRGGRGRFGLL